MLGFPRYPQVNQTQVMLPDFKVFAAYTWSDSDREPAKEEFRRKLNQSNEKIDWLRTFDQGSLESLFENFTK